MNQSGDDLLADAGLACDEYLGVGTRRGIELSFQSTEWLAPADQTYFWMSADQRHDQSPC